MVNLSTISRIVPKKAGYFAINAILAAGHPPAIASPEVGLALPVRPHISARDRDIQSIPAMEKIHTP